MDTLIEKEDPMILLLRIFEVENDFTQSVLQGSHSDHVRTTKLKLIRPVIPKNKNDPSSANFKGTDYFDDIVEKIRKSLGGTKGNVVNDTSLIPFDLPQ